MAIKRKLSRKQKLAGFGGKRAQSAARSRHVAYRSTRKTTKKRKTTRKSGTNVGAIVGAGAAGLIAGGAAGYFTHDAVSGLLQNLANGDVPVLSGIAGLIAGQGNGVAPVAQGEQLSVNQGKVMSTFQGGTPTPIAAPAVGQQQLMNSLYSGLAAEALATGQAVAFSGQRDSSGFPIGIYPMDKSFEGQTVTSQPGYWSN